MVENKRKMGKFKYGHKQKFVNPSQWAKFFKNRPQGLFPIFIYLYNLIRWTARNATGGGGGGEIVVAFEETQRHSHIYLTFVRKYSLRQPKQKFQECFD